jgi:gamma-glutamyltranspeptidase
MAFRDGKFFMAWGTPGGDVQMQAMLQVFLNVTQFGKRVQEAVEAPRVSTKNFPDSFAPHTYYPGRLLAGSESTGGRNRRTEAPRPRCRNDPAVAAGQRRGVRYRPRS